VTRDAVLKEIVAFYLGSRDFNGIPFTELVLKLGLPRGQVKDCLVELIRDGQVTLAFASVSVNPHIRRLADLAIADQIEKLQSEAPEGACAFPARPVIEASVDPDKYADRPFTQRLLLGEPQLQPVYFDLTVLERYHADPRYHFRFYDYGGSISISDAQALSPETEERDKVFLQTFGLGYDSKGNRVVVVYMRYLSDLSPEHQQFWRTYIATKECHMVEEYYQNTISGRWIEHGSIYQAILEEQVVINEMCDLMRRPPLFKQTFRNDRPREFTIFLRPTRDNFLRFILTLDKMLSENINKDFFLNEIRLEEMRRRGDGTIEVVHRGTLTLLHEWLRQGIQVEDNRVFNEIIAPLKEVREKRQAPAHKIESDEFDRSYHHRQNELLRRVYKSLRTIRLLFANHPRVEGYKVPDWLYKGRIKIY